MTLDEEEGKAARFCRIDKGYANSGECREAFLSCK